MHTLKIHTSEPVVKLKVEQEIDYKRMRFAKKLYRCARALNIPREEIHNHLQSLFGVDSTRLLNAEQVRLVYEQLKLMRMAQDAEYAYSITNNTRG